MEKPFYIISTKGEKDREFQTSDEALDGYDAFASKEIKIIKKID